MVTRNISAIALMSGGLDSTLAAKLIKDEDVEVIGLHLASPFGCHTDVQKNAEAIGIPLLIKDKGESYIDLLKNPRYGYGKNMNPCIDCRIFMFQLAAVFMKDRGADFIVTGEVLGQRPMSQTRNSIELIDSKSDPLEGRIVRPLSAHRFAPTIPEQEGWIRREHLLGIVGRGRKQQLALAKEYGIKDYGAPGGGCLLTEKEFSAKIRDFLDNEQYLRTERAEMLRYGRHFRINDTTKVIVGRHEEDNRVLRENYERTDGTLFEPIGYSGPDALVFGKLGEWELDKIGEMILSYSKVDLAEKQKVAYRTSNTEGSFLVSKRMPREELERYRI